MRQRKIVLRLDTLAAFDEDLARLLAADVDLTPLNYVIGVLLKGKKLNPIYYDHPLQTRFQGYRACHIEDDWLLIYEIDKRVLRLIATGTHAELFDR